MMLACRAKDLSGDKRTALRAEKIALTHSGGPLRPAGLISLLSSTRCGARPRRYSALAAQHALLMFAALFMVIFAETGLVIFPPLRRLTLLGVTSPPPSASMSICRVDAADRGRPGDSVITRRRSSAPSFSRTRGNAVGLWLKPSI